MPDASVGPIDVTLVSGRRPELLRLTLDSFEAGLFSRFRIGRFIANIDPIFGDVADHAACLGAIKERFPQAEVFEPQIAGFGAAVKRLWAATTASLVFHLEDDWLLNEPLRPADIFPLLVGDVVSVAPVSIEMGWNGHDFYKTGTRRIRILGFTIRHRTVNIHGTSPRFMTGAFARHCADLMIPALDPEKQMRPPHNSPLRAYVEPLKCRLLPTKGGAPLIVDIGRDWRDARGIKKVISKGKSTWMAQ